MQVAAIEFARNVLGYKDANSREFDELSKHTVIDIMESQKGITDMGGTMRLGLYPCKIKVGSKLYEAYGKDFIEERHRHRFEFNNEFREEYIKNGMDFGGLSPDGRLVESVEIDKNDFFVGVQYHPEFLSRPNRPHPLFVALIKAAKKNM